MRRFGIFRKAPAQRSKNGAARRVRRPLVERLEARELLAVSSISAIQQYGAPSVFAIDQGGTVFSNVLTVVNNIPVFAGWTPVSGANGALAISPGTVGVSGLLRQNMFLLNTGQNIYYSNQDSSGNWNTFSAVGVNVGATSIASGLIPILNAPYVVMINAVNDVWFNYRTPRGSWSGWSPVGLGVGAVQIATGVIRVSLAPTFFEPYVFMINGNHDVFFNVRKPNGTWSGWSPVGVGVGATSISAVTLANKPYVSMLNGAGGIFVNYRVSNHTWAGWSPVGGGSGSSALPATSMAAVGSSYSIYGFAVNTAGQVNSTFGSYRNWSSWIGLGALAPGVGTTSLSVTSSPVAAPFAFAIGTDGNVYWNFQVAWASWSQWSSLGAPI
jgi:hypothetical protein